MPPAQLIATPFELAHRSIAFAELLEAEPLPPVYQALHEEIAAYIAVMIDVLNNHLAQKPYEKLNDLENVTEKEHALQAGKLAYMFGLPLEDILAMLFHDIARPSINDPVHGHINHAKEGGIILDPLGLKTNFTASHGFAKYLLKEFCPPYRKLLSRASNHSLTLQVENLDAEIAPLKCMDSLSLAHTSYKLAFFRVLDDMSKASESLVRKYLAGAQIEYYSNELIEKMMVKQFCTYLKTIPKTPEAIQAIKDRFSKALALLKRAQEYSQHPEIYPALERFVPGQLPEDKSKVLQIG